jgi:formate/nitrite transporter
MNLFSPHEVVRNYIDLGVEKTRYPAPKMYLLGVMAGSLLAFGGVASNTAVHSLENPGLIQVISGFLWPIGLSMVMLLGGELFLGNTMMVTAVVARRASWPAVLKNWLLVYLGNLTGGLLISVLVVFSGQLNLSNGRLALYTIQLAHSKTILSFGATTILGILCNILVCTAVLCSLSAKDTPGRIMGASIPVVFFIISGFENAVANMYLIPVGILALNQPQYAPLAVQAGIFPSHLNWNIYLLRNLLPVTIGNLIGGVGYGLLLWFCHVRLTPKEEQEPKPMSKTLP